MAPWLQIVNALVFAILLGLAYKKTSRSWIENSVIILLLVDMGWVATVVYGMAQTNTNNLGAFGWALAAAAVTFFVAATVDSF